MGSFCHFSRTPTVRDLVSASYCKWEGDNESSPPPTYYSPDKDLAIAVGVRIEGRGYLRSVINHLLQNTEYVGYVVRTSLLKTGL